MNQLKQPKKKKKKGQTICNKSRWGKATTSKLSKQSQLCSWKWMCMRGIKTNNCGNKADCIVHLPQNFLYFFMLWAKYPLAVHLPTISLLYGCSPANYLTALCLSTCQLYHCSMAVHLTTICLFYGCWPVYNFIPLWSFHLLLTAQVTSKWAGEDT